MDIAVKAARKRHAGRLATGNALRESKAPGISGARPASERQRQ